MNKVGGVYFCIFGGFINSWWGGFSSFFFILEFEEVFFRRRWGMVGGVGIGGIRVFNVVSSYIFR